LKNSGFCIRNLKVEVHKEQTGYFWKIIEFLHRMPNLEDLSFEIKKPLDKKSFEVSFIYLRQASCAYGPHLNLMIHFI